MIDAAALAGALSTVFAVENLFFLCLGVVIGILAGILPGINAAIGITLVIPFTYGMEPVTALLMALGLWGGENYGGSVTSILVRTPGAASGAATIFDGHPLHEQGHSGKALGISCIASATGWFISTIILVLLAIPIAAFALRFGPAEYFAVGIFGLSMVSAVSGENLLKGFIATVVGLLLVTVGTDPFSGLPRFTFGQIELFEGIDFLIVMIGVFALSEVLVQASRAAAEAERGAQRYSAELPSWAEIRSVIPTVLRSSVLGTFVGSAPGAGGSIAAFIAYGQAKNFSRHPERFGKGSLEGIAAPESANNATEGGALIPLLTLGVPGSGAAAVILAVMIINGIQPGPQVFEEQPVLVYSLFIGLAIGAFFLLFAGLFAARWLIYAVHTPRPYLVTGITGIACMGGLAISSSIFDLRLAVLFGLIGYLMRRCGFPAAPLVLAMVLGFLIETSLRRAMITADGDWTTFLTRPISATLLALAVASFFWPIVKGIRDRRRIQAAGRG
ncbi:tripartite tricarboxylate transporter permease [Spiribacter halobius]|uniref:C4-dicarboxylate ABC transporter permease n=1 Tax=Sediminicurvatus halobius TaxID=2182432 RepID=A0A2U2N9Q6_9GAMM|nr:tripartite tricarboxylate transporter permease [Spiribacter halobius]PWG65833.1 C4-dicarboxylate ABC transporter permease [Spiribacter halobius]UEX77877.1 tripartite tricarboxylate transporter permease [Spiribacter halobius]